MVLKSKLLNLVGIAGLVTAPVWLLAGFNAIDVKRSELRSFQDVTYFVEDRASKGIMVRPFFSHYFICDTNRDGTPDHVEKNLDISSAHAFMPSKYVAPSKQDKLVFSALTIDFYKK